MSSAELVQLETGAMARITINRPDQLNALNRDVLRGLWDAFDRLEDDKNLRCVALLGAGGKAFVAGADIRSMAETAGDEIADYVELGQRVMRRIETFHVPVIAVVHGFALGGGMELALSCDLILASSKAKFGQPEVNLGVIPGFGGTQRLLQRTSIGAVRRLVYTGEIIGAEEALRLGIIDQMCAPEELEAALNSVAATIGAKGPLAVQKSKEVIRAAGDRDLISGLRAEVQGFLDVFKSADRVEGMQAFLDKRSAQFKGM